jgi:hypothetical protein
MADVQPGPRLLRELRKKFDIFAKDFYDFGASIFKFGPLVSWLRRRLGKPPAQVAIEIFVALSLSVYYFFLIAPQEAAPRSTDGNETNAYLFRYLSHHPYVPNNDLQSTFTAWGARLAGPMISGWVYDQAVAVSRKFSAPGVISDRFDFNGYTFYLGNLAFGFYHAAWLLLLFGILILHRKDALFVILGVFCGLMYNFIVPAGQWFLPWDMPAMFFFTWACLLYDKRQLVPLLAVVWLGSLFKETVMCCALLVLLGEFWPLRKRIGAFAVTVIACILARKLLMMLYGVREMAFAFNCSTNPHELITKPWTTLVQNLDYLAGFHLNSELFINAGVLFLILLIPWRSRRDVSFKILILAFFMGQILLAGSTVFREFREWYELLPLGWMLISEYLSGRFSIVEAGQTEVQPLQNHLAVAQAKPVMVESYWLGMTAMAAIAFGAYVVGDLSSSGLDLDVQSVSNTNTAQPTTNAATNEMAFENARQMEIVKDLNNLAWTFATSPDDKDRSGSLAIQLAKRACEKTNYRVVAPVGTLAAAYAEAAQFDNAISTAQKACGLASAQGETNLLERDEELLALYRKHLPFHQTEPQSSD